MSNKKVIFAKVFLFVLTCIFTGNNAYSSNDSLSSTPLKVVEVEAFHSVSNSICNSHSYETEIGSSDIKVTQQSSLLPVLSEYVPSFFSTARSTMGYGVSSGAAGNMTIRGLSSSSAQLSVSIDGIPQFMGIMGHPIADVSQSYFADHIYVTPQGISIQTPTFYSDTVRTIVNIGYGLYNTLQSDVVNMIRKKKFFSTLGISYNRSDGHRENMDFHQLDGFAKLGAYINSHWCLFGEMNIAHINSSQSGSIATPLVDADQEVTRGTTSLNISNSYGRTTGNIFAFYTWGKHWLNDGYTLDTTDSNNKKMYRFDSNDHVFGAGFRQYVFLVDKGRTSTRLDLHAWWMQMGGLAQNKFVEGPNKGNTKPLVDKVEDEVTSGLTLIQTFRLVNFRLGTNVSHHVELGTAWLPYANLDFYHYSSKSRLNWEVTVRKSNRFPTLKDRYFGTAANEELEAENFWTYDLGMNQKFEKLAYKINLFHVSGNNIILTVPVEGTSTSQNRNSGEIRNSGVESQISYTGIDAWEFHANYSYLI